MISYKVIRTFEELEGLAEAWPELLRRSPHDHVFLTWEWMSAWAKTHLRGDELLVVIISDHDRPVALAPLWVDVQRFKNVFKHRVLRFLGTGVACSDYLDFIIERENRDTWVQEIWNQLFGTLRREWDIFEFFFVRHDSRVLSRVHKLADEDDRCLAFEIRDMTTCPYLRLPASPEDLLASLTASRRYTVNYSTKQLAKRGALEFRQCTDPDQLSAELTRLQELNTANWRKKGQPGSFATVAFRNFHLQFSRIALKQDRLMLCSLWAGEEYLGTFYGFRYNGVLYFYIMSVVQCSQNRVNTGDVLLMHCMDHAVQTGCREFDFLRGGEDYKYRWTDEERRLVSLRIYRRSIRAGIVYLARSIYRSARVVAKDLFGARRNGKKSSPPLPALVLGNEITALGAIRGLGQEGVPVYQVAAKPEWERFSRWRKQPTWRPELVRETGNSTEDLTRLLSDPDVPPAVLISCADSWSLAIASLSPALKARFPSSQASAETLASLVDKERLARILSDCDIPHPRIFLLPEVDLAVSLAPDFFKEAFVKPRNSQAFFNHFGVKAFRVQSEQEARLRIALAHAAGLETILQEYIPGPASEHYFIDGFMDRQGSMCGLFARRRLRMYPPDFGNSTYQVSIPLTEADACVRSLERLFKATSYRGLFSAEFKHDVRDGAFKLIEVNVRAWWYLWFAERCGMPLTYMAYQDALGKAVACVRDYETGVHCVRPYIDLNSCRWLHQRGEVTSFEWIRTAIWASHADFAWSDPLPSVMGALGGLYNKIRRSRMHALPTAPAERTSAGEDSRA